MPRRCKQTYQSMVTEVYITTLQNMQINPKVTVSLTCVRHHYSTDHAVINTHVEYMTQYGHVATINAIILDTMVINLSSTPASSQAFSHGSPSSCTLLLLFLPHSLMGCTHEATRPHLVRTGPSIQTNAGAVSTLH